MKFKIAYFGSSYFSAIFLEKLIQDEALKKNFEIKFAVTQPDKPLGRKQILTPTPVKKTAKKYKLPVFDKPEQSFDLGLVYAYGEIIHKKLLDLPKYGFLNVHPSLLPKYRGTSPIATPLINGEKETGVTIIKMDEQIDHGPIIAQEKYEILPTDKRPDLEIKLTDLAYLMFKTTVKISPPWKEIHQNQTLATYTKKLAKQDGFIDFKNLKLKIKNFSEELYNLFRGLYPWPGIWTILPNGKRLKITDMELKKGKLLLKRVQLEGKKEVDFETFSAAYKFF